MSSDAIGAMVIGGIFVLSGIFSCWAGVCLVLRSRRIRRNGLRATATVVATRYEDQRSGTSQGQTTTTRWYYITVKWQGVDGGELQGEWSTIRARLYEALPVGATAQILYLPPKPGSEPGSPEFEFEDEPAEHRYATGCWIWAVIGLGAGGAALAWGVSQMAK